MLPHNSICHWTVSFLDGTLGKFALDQTGMTVYQKMACIVVEIGTNWGLNISSCNACGVLCRRVMLRTNSAVQVDADHMD